MSTIRNTTTFLILSVSSILFFSGYKAAKDFNSYQTKELQIIISLDSVKPGPITLKQVLSLKQLNVKADGITHLSKTYDFLIIPKKGPSHYVKCTGYKFELGTLNTLRNCKPGDLILVSNLVLLGDPKYKTIVDPKWTVVADPK